MDSPDSRLNIDSFTWKNLAADAMLGTHSYTMQLYLEQVVLPALDAIDSRWDALGRSDNAAAEFELIDLDTLRTATIEAFALSTQSIWERHPEPTAKLRLQFAVEHMGAHLQQQMFSARRPSAHRIHSDIAASLAVVDDGVGIVVDIGRVDRTSRAIRCASGKRSVLRQALANPGRQCDGVPRKSLISNGNFWLCAPICTGSTATPRKASVRDGLPGLLQRV
jgi:hypothetical protein